MPYTDPEARAEYRRNWQRERRREWRVWVLRYMGGSCVVCGATDKLDIHHIDPSSKEFSVSQIWCHRIEKQLAELAKCELRCRKHHGFAHRLIFQHGDVGKYEQGCRCDPCKSARRIYNAKWMADWRARGLDKSRPMGREPGLS